MPLQSLSLPSQIAACGPRPPVQVVPSTPPEQVYTPCVHSPMPLPHGTSPVQVVGHTANARPLPGGDSSSTPSQSSSRPLHDSGAPGQVPHVVSAPSSSSAPSQSSSWPG